MRVWGEVGAVRVWHVYVCVCVCLVAMVRFVVRVVTRIVTRIVTGVAGGRRLAVALIRLGHAVRSWKRRRAATHHRSSRQQREAQYGQYGQE